MNAKDKQLLKALDLIGKQEKGIRSDTLGAFLEIDHTQVEEMLAPLVEQARLLTCTIKRPERADVIEYKLSMAVGQGKAKFQKPTPPGRPARAKSAKPAAPLAPAPVVTKPQKQPTNIDKSQWPRPTSKTYPVLLHLEAHGSTSRAKVAELLKVEPTNVPAYMADVVKKGLVVCDPVANPGTAPINYYRLPHQAKPSTTPTPAGEQGSRQIEPSGSASSEGVDTATQPSSSAATPPGSNDEGQCSKTPEILTRAQEIERNGAALLTEKEIAIADLLGDAWNEFLELPVQHPSERDEFCRAIHQAQHMVLARSGQRQIKQLT